MTSLTANFIAQGHAHVFAAGGPLNRMRRDGDAARQRLPAMLRWLEENGRELLETP